MKLKVISLFLASVVILSACTQASENPTTQESAVSDSSQQVSNDLEPESFSADVTSSDSSDSMEAETTIQKQYADYSPELAAQLKEDGSPHVIFFHANWCSWCRRMERDLTEQFDTFADNAVVLKADFDSETKLRQEYGVTVKDTYAFIGSDGETVAVKSGATLDDLKDFFVSNQVSDEVEENPTGVAFYGDYDPDVVETFVGKKPYALFFHADWCPACKTLDEELTAGLADFSTSVAVFKTDYDSNVDLRKEYGVTMQHTLVAFDANGEVKEVIPGFTVDDVERVFAK